MEQVSSQESKSIRNYSWQDAIDTVIQTINKSIDIVDEVVKGQDITTVEVESEPIIYN
jgi:hypothetical protein